MQTLPAWARWCMEKPKTVIALFLLACVITGFGAGNLYFRGDYKVFFEPDDPQKLAYEEMQNVFSKSENVTFLILPDSENVYQPETFELIHALTEDAWHIPMSNRVESLSNYQYTFADEEGLVVQDLIRKGQTDEAHIRWVREVIEPIQNLRGRLISDNEAMAVINVTIQLPEGDQTPKIMKIGAFARELKEKYETAYPDHKIYLSGIVTMNDAFALTAQDDASTLIPLMFIIIAVMIALLTRSKAASAVVLVVVGGTIVMTMGIAGWWGIFLSPSTVNVPTMVTTLAVADCLHIIVTYRQKIQQGLAKEQALAESIMLNLKAVLLTSGTTAIGFLMLNFAEVPILSHLGNLTAVGVVLACILSLTVLPAMLTLLPAPRVREQNGDDTQVKKLGGWVISNHRRILPYSVIVLTVSLLFCLNNRLNDVAVEYFDLSSPFRQSVEIQKKYMGGMSNIDFAVYTGEPYGINDPAVMKEVDALAKWLRSQPEVKHVLSFADIIKRLNMNMHDDDPAYFTLPESKDLAAQYLLLYEMSLPYGLDLNNQIDIDKSGVRIIAVLENLGSEEFTEFEARTKRWFGKLAPELRLEAASPALMFAHIGARNMESMVWGSVAALVVISLLITLALRSWRLGIVSLMANLMPAGVGFGIWGMMSGEINMALSVELSMTMGIIVDDSVHFLLKYQAARKDNMNVRDSVEYAFRTVGRAMITTTVVLAAGFGVLLLSDFRLNSDMGLMTNIIFIAALFIDLLFLPSFLMWLDKDKNKTTREAT